MGDVLGRDLNSERCPERIGTERSEVFVEVPGLRGQGYRLDPGSLRPFGRDVTRRINVAGDVEAAKRFRKQDGGEMRSRKRRHHRHGG